MDHLFIDEAQYYKNLETPTKMERVAGIQTGGSERAFDLYMKARYLSEQHPGHGVTFATGTPISNTMVELYTVQRFLDPEGLKSRGIEHFDALFRSRNKASYADSRIMPPRFADFGEFPRFLRCQSRHNQRLSRSRNRGPTSGLA